MMPNEHLSARIDTLLVPLLACVAATLLHHVHNAEFLDEYPNMPAWLSSAGVYAAWLAATAVGSIGYVLVRRGFKLAGWALLSAYGIYGLNALGHYALAPLWAHTPMMNVTIWLEAATGVFLLSAVTAQVLKRLRR